MISVIVPASRTLTDLTNIVNDFNAQTYRDFELIVVYDGEPDPSIINYFKTVDDVNNTSFYIIEKSPDKYPGTTPRNYGTKQARGKFVVYADDDDRYLPTYLEALHSTVDDEYNSVGIVQMQKDGVAIPKYKKLWYWPEKADIGTPCFIVPRIWALAYPWPDKVDHDYFFISKIINMHLPMVRVNWSVQVIVH